MKFSVLITTFNECEFLQQAVESVFAQTYQEPFQLVIVNDGSDDGIHGDGIKDLSHSQTRAYLNILKPPKHIKVGIIHNQRNLGLQKAFNIGLYHCKGEWVARLDHDDKLLPDALGEVSKFIDSENNQRLGLIYTNLLMQDGKERRYPDFIPGLLRSCFEIGHLQVARRKALEEVNGWPVGLDYSADTACIIDLVEYGWQIKHLDKTLLWNRLHERQYTQQYILKGGRPNDVKNKIANRTLALRPDLWIEAREMNVLSASTHYWMTEAMAVLPHCVGIGADIGCGPRKKYPYAIGVDLDRGGGKIPEVICDVEKKELPFADGSLDYISICHVVEHFQNPVDTLMRLAKKIRIGGKLLLIVPDTTYTPKMGDENGDQSHRWDFTPESFKPMVADKLSGLNLFQYDTLKNQWSFDAFFLKKESQH